MAIFSSTVSVYDEFLGIFYRDFFIEISQKLAHLGGERVGVDKNFVPGDIDGADGEPGAILFRRKQVTMVAANAAEINEAVSIRSPNLAPRSSIWRHSMLSVSLGHWCLMEAAPGRLSHGPNRPIS